MRKLFFSLLLAGLGACQQQPAPVAAVATDQVNALVGNASYVAAFGQEPTVGTDDQTRIRTHLAYAERQLRQRTPAGLSPALARRRTHLLDLLHQYWTAGVFPRNFDYAERRPCFIDRDGRLCAVGYLVAQTAGRPVAEAINRAHQYDRIADMRAPELGRWVAASGLSKAECALIQPTYQRPVLPQEDVPVANHYAVPSMMWSGLNVAFGAVSATQLSQAAPRPGLAWVGMASGAGQVLLGALNLPKDEVPEPTLWGPQLPVRSFAAERSVSYVNIGVGTATLALSAWNLLCHRQAAQLPRTAVGVVSFPAASGSAGLALTRRF